MRTQALITSWDAFLAVSAGSEISYKESRVFSFLLGKRKLSWLEKVAVSAIFRVQSGSMIITRPLMFFKVMVEKLRTELAMCLSFQNVA